MTLQTLAVFLIVGASAACLAARLRRSAKNPCECDGCSSRPPVRGCGRDCAKCSKRGGCRKKQAKKN